MTTRPHSAPSSTRRLDDSLPHPPAPIRKPSPSPSVDPPPLQLPQNSPFTHHRSLPIKKPELLCRSAPTRLRLVSLSLRENDDDSSLCDSPMPLSQPPFIEEIRKQSSTGSPTIFALLNDRRLRNDADILSHARAGGRVARSGRRLVAVGSRLPSDGSPLNLIRRKTVDPEKQSKRFLGLGLRPERDILRRQLLEETGKPHLSSHATNFQLKVDEPSSLPSNQTLPKSPSSQTLDTLTRPPSPVEFVLSVPGSRKRQIR